MDVKLVFCWWERYIGLWIYFNGIFKDDIKGMFRIKEVKNYIFV